MFKTELKTIKKLLTNGKITFIIPTYQRPYVWEQLDIKKFLEDIIDAKAHQQYFIGNVFVTQTKGKENDFDVIDGQQRFTTLWLIALAFKQLNIATELTSFLNFGDKLRLNFNIRNEVEQYLKFLLSKDEKHSAKTDKITSEFLIHIADGIETIKGILQVVPIEERADLGNFIYENVAFVYNTAPENTDLNILFTALGNSGIQLEQTDILKSFLLKSITERVLYSKIWEACENMNDYFENNVVAIFPGASKTNIPKEHFRKFDRGVFKIAEQSLTAQHSVEGKTLAEIIADESPKVAIVNENRPSYIRGRSIIPFSVLLLHTYRIFRKDQGDFIKEFDKKNLLSIFEDLIQLKDDEQEIKRFFELLWEVRYLFDKHIVKWRSDAEGEHYIDDDEKLRLTTISKESNRENKVHSNESMLQSVLYFNGGFNQQYWLSPYLSYLLEDTSQDKDTLAELEKIDNLMLPGTRKEISWRLMDAEERNRKVETVKQYFNVNLGLGFNHYWFYKIEYLLWKNWDKADPRLRKYRITSKNSIEHVYPQNPELSERINKESLDNFGNLGLLSVGQNSSYSHQEPAKKREDFEVRAHKNCYDSLKLAKIYTSFTGNEWDASKIEIHKSEMITLLSRHYEAGSEQLVFEEGVLQDYL